MFWLRFIHVHSHFEPTHIQLRLDCAGFDGTVQLTVAPFDDGRLVWSHSHHSPPISCTRERVCDVKFQKQSKRNRDVIIQMRQTFRTGCFALRVFLFVLPTSQPGLLVSAYSSGSEQKARNLLPGHFLGALGSAWIHILAGSRHPETLVGRNTTFLPATVLSCFSTFNPNSHGIPQSETRSNWKQLTFFRYWNPWKPQTCEATHWLWTLLWLSSMGAMDLVTLVILIPVHFEELLFLHICWIKTKRCKCIGFFVAHLMPNSANRSFGIRMSEFHAVNLNRLGPTWDTTLPVACCSRRLWHQHVFAIFCLYQLYNWKSAVFQAGKTASCW